MIDWTSTSISEWKKALERYENFLTTPEKRDLDRKISETNQSVVQRMSDVDFYNYLYEDFFVWKYTAKNRLSTTRNALKRKQDWLLSKESLCVMSQLGLIKEKICEQTLSDTELFKWALSIPGLGSAGASALLASMYPTRFGVVDQFVVKNLQIFMRTDQVIMSIHPSSIKLNEAIYLEGMLREKARQLNGVAKTNFWTPRKIDQAIWADR